MLIRVLLSTLTALLFLAVSPDVIRAQEKLPDGAFTFTSSPDELNWRPFFFLERSDIYIGANGYSVELVRIPPYKEGPPFLTHSIDTVIRVQSGTLYLALRESGRVASGDLIEYSAYGPGSLIVLPAGITQRMLAGDDEVILELTQVRNIARRSSE